MAYNKNIWTNSNLPAINDTNLNHIEEGIEAAHNAIDSTNTKLTSLTTYSTEEINTGKKWIDGKPIYRKIIDCGALLNNTIKTVAHNISNLDFIIFLNGTSYSSTTGNYFPLPYAADSLQAIVKIWATDTNIYLQTTADRTDYTITYVTIEYTKTTDEV